MAIKMRFLLIFLLILLFFASSVHAALAQEMEDKPCFKEKGIEAIMDLKEAEEYLQCLSKERETMEGDFYGINITAYRYVNIFDRLGYIRYRIDYIDKEIEKIQLQIKKLKSSS